MLRPNTFQFSLRHLLVLTAGVGLACYVGTAGGWHWLLFAMLCVGSACVLGSGYRWAVNGDGYWPRGLAGELLLMMAVLLAPLALVTSSALMLGAIGRQTRFWFPLPFPL